MIVYKVVDKSGKSVARYPSQEKANEHVMFESLMGHKDLSVVRSEEEESLGNYRHKDYEGGLGTKVLAWWKDKKRAIPVFLEDFVAPAFYPLEKASTPDQATWEAATIVPGFMGLTLLLTALSKEDLDKLGRPTVEGFLELARELASFVDYIHKS